MAKLNELNDKKKKLLGKMVRVEILKGGRATI